MIDELNTNEVDIKHMRGQLKQIYETADKEFIERAQQLPKPSLAILYIFFSLAKDEIDKATIYELYNQQAATFNCPLYSRRNFDRYFRDVEYEGFIETGIIGYRQRGKGGATRVVIRNRMIERNNLLEAIREKMGWHPALSRPTLKEF